MENGGTFEGFEDQASRGIQEVKSKQEKVKLIESKDLLLEYQEQTRSFITKWCIFLLVVLVCSALIAAFADSTNQTFFKDGVLERTLKVAGLILPIITLALGFYFGSPGKR